MASKAPVIDLDAHRRESAYPDGIPLLVGGEDFVLPAQFPLETLDPFLAEELGLVKIIREFMADEEKDDVASILDTLVAHPTLPKQAIAAVMEALGVLFGEEQFERFRNTSPRPGVGDYLFIARSLFGAYGVTLGEAFASPDSSENGGATPSPTSTATAPESTSNGSGFADEPVWDPIPAVEPAREPDAYILPAPAPEAPSFPSPVPVPAQTPQD